MDRPDARDLFDDFAAEAEERLDRLEELLLAAGTARAGAVPALLEEVRRELHTLKGNAGLMGFTALQELAHQLEDEVEEIDPARPASGVLLAGVDRFRALLRAGGEGDEGAATALPGGQSGEGSVRIPFATLDALIDLLAEVVIARNRLADALEGSRAKSAGPALAPVDEQLALSHERLATTLDLLQERVLRLRMVPLAALFRQLGRIVHDESEAAGKEVRFVTEGGDTPLDKALLELASDALGHLVRNAVIHGLESPAERAAGGKPRQGTLRLSADATAREVRIEVADDGRGVDRDAVLAAAERGGYPYVSGTDPLQLLFLPGLSTRVAADLGAGRGIGLSAVQEAVQRHGGGVEVASRPGAGTLFRLRLPLSASITRAMLVRADGEDYALPVRAVVESLRLAAGDLHEINGAGVLRWRGGVLPALDLGLAFGTAAARRQEGYAVVIEDNGRYRGLVADQVLGLREIVVKQLDPALGAPPGLAGSTLLGDGRAVLILDPAGLLAMAPFAGAEVRA
jgi:two-component system, chemotaxis family, sensor kinase CheA